MPACITLNEAGPCAGANPACVAAATQQPAPFTVALREPRAIAPGAAVFSASTRHQRECGGNGEPLWEGYRGTEGRKVEQGTPNYNLKAVVNTVSDLMEGVARVTGVLGNPPCPRPGSPPAVTRRRALAAWPRGAGRQGQADVGRP
ncbi:hypothetical protein E2C01_024009 [Portunus trituberculatus]|uniref:Uncharacterized protein n=1 Tax=Portunus trituberculatus TaxID=210409 RepID=A0A5B7EBK0_PORTR|nr:hypothetical protein [Portunus trituberculatus]